MNYFIKQSIWKNYNFTNECTILKAQDSTITTNIIFLEEQVVSLAKMVESLTTSLKEMDDKMAFTMRRILELTRKRPVNEEVRHENIQEEAIEQSSVQVVKHPQPTINEVVNADQFNELIKEVFEDQVNYVTQPSYP